MALLRFRIAGNDDHVRAISNLLQSLDGIEHVEEVGDLMPHMDDPDSSSAGLHDTRAADTHEIEVEVPNASTERRVREAVEALAFDLDTFVEIETGPQQFSRREVGAGLSDGINIEIVSGLNENETIKQL